MGAFIKQNKCLMKKYLDFSIFLVFFSTPFESIAIIPGVSVVKFVTLIFFFFGFLYIKEKGFKSFMFIRYFLFYTIYVLLSPLWSIEIEISLIKGFGTVLPTFLVTMLLMNSINTQEQVNGIFKSYAFGSIILAGYSLYKYFTEFRYLLYANSRVTVFDQDQNELSFLLIFGVVSILYLLLFVKLNKSLTFIYIIALPLLIFSILSTGSRTGFIMLIFVGFIYVVIKMRTSSIIYIAPIIVVSSIYLFFNLPPAISDRLLETSEQIEGGDMTNRGDIWVMGLKGFEMSGKFILGTGYDTFRDVTKTYFNYNTAGHNTYLITFIELGIIGFLFFANMLVYLMKKVWILVKYESIFYSTLIIPLLLAMMTLGLSNRRWMFIIGVLIIKLSELLITKKDTLKYGK
jgi:O-antigen ligase